MDLGPIDLTHADSGPAAITGAAPAHAGRPHTADSADVRPDSVATQFGNVSAADIAKLNELISHSLSAPASAHLHELAPGAGPRIDPIQDSTRSGLEPDLHRHIALARWDAEGRLALAAQRVGLAGLERLSGWQMRPDTMVTIAHRIFDAGGPANYARAAVLAQIVIDGTPWVPGVNGIELAAQESVRSGSNDGSKPTGEAPQALSLWLGPRIAVLVRSLWLRAPLLVLLFSWLAIGITGGVGSLLWRKLSLSTWPGSLSALAFDMWGIGFLFLVLFGFYTRVRHLRF